MPQNILFKKLENSALLIVKVCLAVAWATLIFAILESPMPVVESDAKGFTISDKLTHIFLFGTLLWLVLDAIKTWRGTTRKFTLNKESRGINAGNTGKISRVDYFSAIFSVFAFAYFCEYLQRFVPTRTSSLTDLSFGALGIVLGLLCYFFFQKKAPLRTGHMRIKKPKLLVHLCCGPCGAQISRELRDDYEVSLFFANSNIDNKSEFNKRLKAVEALAKHNNLPLLVAAYDHEDWLKFIKGFEEEIEGGHRCLLCYRYRLAKTAQTASAQGFAWFTTSLSVSPHKDSQAIIHLGKAEAVDNKAKFLDRHFGLGDGFRQSVAKAKELGLYRQKYCGCEFSKRQGK